MTRRYLPQLILNIVHMEIIRNPHTSRLPNPRIARIRAHSPIPRITYINVFLLEAASMDVIIRTLHLPMTGPASGRDSSRMLAR
jgi:hypothetical protein